MVYQWLQFSCSAALIEITGKVWYHVIGTGGTEKVRDTGKLAARVHNGRYSDAAEKGDGGPA